MKRRWALLIPVVLLAGVGAVVSLALRSSAVDLPHWPGGSEGFEFGSNGCDGCHVFHNALGSTLTKAGSIENLCTSCHNDLLATAVDNHAAVQGTANCDFCTYTFSNVTCTDCHNPHGHRQTGFDRENAAGVHVLDGGATDSSPDMFIATAVRKPFEGTLCTDSCELEAAGTRPDPADGNCTLPDQTCAACDPYDVCNGPTNDRVGCVCPLKYASCATGACYTYFVDNGGTSNDYTIGYSGASCNTLLDCTKAGNECGRHLAAGSATGTCATTGGNPCDAECTSGYYNDTKNSGACTLIGTGSCPGVATSDTSHGEFLCHCPVNLAPSTCQAVSGCASGFAYNAGTGTCEVASCSGDGSACGPSNLGTCRCSTGNPADCAGSSGTFVSNGSTASGGTNPTNALTGPNTSHAIATSGQTVTLSSFAQDSGTITQVVAKVRYKTSPSQAGYTCTKAGGVCTGICTACCGAQNKGDCVAGGTTPPFTDDTYSFEVRNLPGGGTLTVTGFPSSAEVGAYTEASVTLPAAVDTWAEVAALQLAGFVTTVNTADPGELHFEWGRFEVTRSSGGAGTWQCKNEGSPGNGYATNWMSCTSGYVADPVNGGCMTDPCASQTCGGTGTCYVDGAGAAICDCPGQYYGSACDQCALPSLQCQCNSPYTGPNCDQCIAGYHVQGGVCVPNATACSPSCTNGSCVYDDGGAFCACSGRYYGASCSSCNPSYGTSGYTSYTIAPLTSTTFGGGDATTNGICEVCHTQTLHHANDDSADPGDTGHYPNQDCIRCHRHQSSDVPRYPNSGPPRNGSLTVPGTGGFLPTAVIDLDGDGLLEANELQTCASCHLSAPTANDQLKTGNFDRDSYDWDGDKAMIDYQEWAWYGHGNTANSNYPSGNGRANFDDTGPNPEDPAAYSGRWAGAHGCDYCHDSTVSHNTPGNYFRLANTADPNYGALGTCMVCHGSKDTNGYDPDGAGGVYAAINAVDIDTATDYAGGEHAWHEGNLHGSKGGPGSTGGQFCWDCHDPHGDVDNAGAAAGDALWFMFQRVPVEDSETTSLGRKLSSPCSIDANCNTADGEKCDPFSGLCGTPVELRDNLSGAANGVLEKADLRAANVGICRSCHDVTSKFNSPTDEDTHPETYDPTATTCLQCHQHDKGFQGICVNCGTQTCRGCHVDAAQSGGNDVRSFAYDGTRAYISGTEWGVTGHGRPTASGTYPGFTTNPNPAANFDGLTATDTAVACEYCHDMSYVTGGTHPAASPAGNYFMLANVNQAGAWASNSLNDNCLVCHAPGAPGYDAGGSAPLICNGNSCTPNDRSRPAVNTAHWVSAHGAAGGGLYCWNCHDPHGDNNHLMFQSAAWKANNALLDGRPATGAEVTTVLTITTGLDANNLDFGDYKNPSGPICGQCHTTAGSGICQGTNCPGHNDSGAGRCTNCHAHAGNFQASGDCTQCHNSQKNQRRNVATDFAGTRKSGHNKRGTSTPYDCILCHLEGNTDGTINSAYHNESRTCSTDSQCPGAGAGSCNTGTGKCQTYYVDLRDVDSNPATPTGWQYWDIDTLVNTPNTGVSCSSPNSRTQMSMFCVRCHDGGPNAALLTALTAGGDTVTRSTQRPFGDGYNAVNVNAQINPTSKHSTHSSSCYWNGTAWASADHADVATGTFNTTYSWLRSSQTECADCHLPGNTTATPAFSGNAHGSQNTAFLLDDMDGKDVAFTMGGDATQTHTCMKCHDRSTYSSASASGAGKSSWHHGQNMSMMQEGGSRDNVFQWWCFGCHAGGWLPANISGWGQTCTTDADCAAGGHCSPAHPQRAAQCWPESIFGTIHGEADTLTDDDNGQSTPALRFFNGAQVDRFNNPDGKGISCSTTTPVRGNNIGCDNHKAQGANPG